MKLFACPSCGQVIYFGNVRCVRCDTQLGYDGDANRMVVVDATWKRCANHAYDVCSWLVPATSPDALCRACSHNDTIPDLGRPENLELWRKIEEAKHRLLYTCLRLHLPLAGLRFQFVEAMTGHNAGLITIALAEADDSEREKRRHALGEPYRTLLGHFRHEVGHWYWDQLVRPNAAAFTALFGDPNEDYAAALKRHYATGPKPGWQDTFVSPYAGAHPWEDFAETWAHYFHILDTLETGGSFGIVLSPRLDQDQVLSTSLDFDVYAADMATLATAWVALSSALNSFNRSMGLVDPYPFVLSPAVIGKLEFIHELVRHAGASRAL
jgi:hypothetical protein